MTEDNEKWFGYKTHAGSLHVWKGKKPYVSAGKIDPRYVYMIKLKPEEHDLPFDELEKRYPYIRAKSE
jgi:hypothetical protein